MLTIRSRSRRCLFAGATVVLTATVGTGCHQRQAADPGTAQEAKRSDNANVLERHEMNPSASSFLELIQGRLAGVLIRQRGASLSVQIRGQGSINSSNEALIMIDGIETGARSLTSINPRDVERVEVLKDGAAAIYGMRGANGVLLITTRRR
jgi:TonB-dependent SusC/RagA subfamily outer membrane receptor